MDRCVAHAHLQSGFISLSSAHLHFLSIPKFLSHGFFHNHAHRLTDFVRYHPDQADSSADCTDLCISTLDHGDRLTTSAPVLNPDLYGDSTRLLESIKALYVRRTFRALSIVAWLNTVRTAAGDGRPTLLHWLSRMAKTTARPFPFGRLHCAAPHRVSPLRKKKLLRERHNEPATALGN